MSDSTEERLEQLERRVRGFDVVVEHLGTMIEYQADQIANLRAELENTRTHAGIALRNAVPGVNWS
jgi:uncharacterized coiled-coil protein SlyX